MRSLKGSIDKLPSEIEILAMNDELGRKLDAVANAMAKIKFSPTGSNLDTWTWQITRKGTSLEFRHNDTVLKVDGWKLVNPEGWKDTVYPVISRHVRNYYYQGNVEWRAGKTEGKGTCVFGFWCSREALLNPLARGEAWQDLGDLLRVLDKQLAYLFHVNLLSKVEAKPRAYPEDRRVGTWRKEF